ncbi:glycerophosphodiester phosphodiesterase [Rhodoferax sp.]|uniref:glycerophosphodiester phosphodiesterase n=1 Tax=Rhodoferax sp. TaxID=50421 RepID=UPI002715D243|nr:glycerophosphodiester phosphodiesterase [Rhodoferax sp.]MDO9145074.1 glycerophosphodiester phosphodiesterase [Rhodoferax sp.]MDP3864579.1 glycerophosphodiester phosphodiesterase [Rhodoferax sp.]
MPPSPWPYPRWIAHRGAGQLAPENTLAAFRLGASHGYRMFECDVKLSSDGVPFLLHDDSLTRTTDAAEKLGANSDVIAGNHPWGVLAQLDAGSWHSRRFAGEPLPTLDAIARFCLRNGYCINIEIKPSPGQERQTGDVVARHVARLWQNASVPPLLTSFEVPALEAAMAAQPELPRGLLLEALWPGWLETAQRLGCVAIICDHVLWDQVSVTQAQSAGFKTLSYTVNEEAAARRLLDLDIDGIITDRIDLFAPVSLCA